MKEVEKTIDDLCKLIQKKTENCKESYEVNELTELTQALAELITARARHEFSDILAVRFICWS